MRKALVAVLAGVALAVGVVTVVKNLRRIPGALTAMMVGMFEHMPDQ